MCVPPSVVDSFHKPNLEVLLRGQDGDGIRLERPVYVVEPTPIFSLRLTPDGVLEPLEKTEGEDNIPRFRRKW